MVELGPIVGWQSVLGHHHLIYLHYLEPLQNGWPQIFSNVNEGLKDVEFCIGIVGLDLPDFLLLDLVCPVQLPELVDGDVHIGESSFEEHHSLNQWFTRLSFDCFITSNEANLFFSEWELTNILFRRVIITLAWFILETTWFQFFFCYQSIA